MKESYEVVRLEKLFGDSIVVELCCIVDEKAIIEKQDVLIKKHNDKIEVLPKTECFQIPENEEEEFIQKQAVALRKFLPEILPQTTPLSVYKPLPVPLLNKQNIVLYLTICELIDLNITIGDVVNLNILKVVSDK